MKMKTVGLYLVGLCVCSAILPAASLAADWAQGDAVVAVGNGSYKVYSNSGAFKETLSDGFGGLTTGCAFDAAGDLYTTNFTNNVVVKYSEVPPHLVLLSFSTAGVTPPTDTANESLLFDAAGNLYVSHADGDPVSTGTAVHKYTAAGTLLQEFNVVTERRGSDWLELAANQTTLFYTSEGRRIRRYDVAASVQLPDFVFLSGGLFSGNVAYAFRLLPPGDGGGGLLVADAAEIKRLNGSGVVVQTYDAAGEDNWFALNLDPNGTSFWSGDLTTGQFYRFNIATGAIEAGPISTGAPSGTFGGICVRGELTVSRPTPTVTPSNTRTATRTFTRGPTPSTPSPTSPAGAQALPVVWRASPFSTSCTGPSDGSGQPWINSAFDDSGWTPLTLPDRGSYRDRFHRGHFQLVAPVSDLSVFVRCDDGCDVYVNGVSLGSFGNGSCHQLGCVNHPGCGVGYNQCVPPIAVPQSQLAAGDNIVTVHVSNGDAVLAQFDATVLRGVFGACGNCALDTGEQCDPTALQGACHSDFCISPGVVNACSCPGTPASPTVTRTATPSPLTVTSVTVMPTPTPTDTPTGTVPFEFTGGEQMWVVPNGVTSVDVDARGAQGGGGNTPADAGGLGGRVQTTLTVTPGETLYIYVGGKGGDPVKPNTAGTGGFNGGGLGAIDNVDANGPSAGGGGASDIRRGGNSISDRVIVAGAGGGAECCGNGNGGAGGGTGGVAGGSQGYSNAGGGGTQMGGGAGGSGSGSSGNGTPGIFWQGGAGGNGNRAGAGGGGGWYGGGGGGGALYGSGGGGGSGYPPDAIHTTGFQSGNGYVSIAFTLTGAGSTGTPTQTPTPSPPTAVSVTVTPTGTASRLKLAYYALGDSFAAGHGLPGGGRTLGTCRRSAYSYPIAVFANLQQLPQFETARIGFLACSGAESHTAVPAPSVDDPNPFDPVDLPAQVRTAIDGATADQNTINLFTITIGANDFDFEKESLTGQNLCRVDFRNFNSWLAVTTAGVRADVRYWTAEILRSVPHSVVVVTDYYNPFNRSSDFFAALKKTFPGLRNPDCSTLSTEDLYTRTELAVRSLNRALGDAVTTLDGAGNFMGRVAIVSVASQFRRHESARLNCGSAFPGTGTTFVQYPGLDIEDLLSQPVVNAIPELIFHAYKNRLLRGDDCFHPNQKGALAYAFGVGTCRGTTRPCVEDSECGNAAIDPNARCENRSDQSVLEASRRLLGNAIAELSVATATRPNRIPISVPKADAGVVAYACCAAQSQPGCTASDCQACVCDLDPTCCAQAWDAFCAEAAAIECQTSCGCPHLSETPTETPTPTATGSSSTPTVTATPGGACCESHGGPGCDLGACEQCVCGLEESCCGEVWGPLCPDLAGYECLTSCGCPSPTPANTPTPTSEGGPPTETPTPTPGGDCCAAHQGPNCNTGACTACVCASDSFCCDTAWDEICTVTAANGCLGSCACPSPTSTPSATLTAPPTQIATVAPTLAPSLAPTPTQTEMSTSTSTSSPTRTPTATSMPIPTSTPTPVPTKTLVPTPTPVPCIGDCDGHGSVTVNELITMVTIALSNSLLSTCPVGDADGSGGITVNEIIQAVNNALNGCEWTGAISRQRSAVSSDSDDAAGRHGGRGSVTEFCTNRSLSRQ